MLGGNKKAKLGDLFEIATPKGLAYFQYTHKNPLYGALIRVLPGVYEQQPGDVSELAHQEERFYAFFPLAAAVNQELVRLVAHTDIPERAKRFPVMRRRGEIDQTGKVLNWWLWDGENNHEVGELSPEQRKLSIASSISDVILIRRIVSGWFPEDEV